MEITRRCLECYYSARELNPTPEQIITGQVPHLCLALPPSAQLLAANHGMVTVAFYPLVNAETVSCGNFQPQQSKLVS